jgi:predicted AAA+ superfamily ATPase
MFALNGDDMTDELFRRSVIDDILDYLYTKDIIVLHGARQVGKTSILKYLQGYLKNKGEKIVYLDLEDGRIVSLLDRGVGEFLSYLEGEGYPVSETDPGRKRTFVMIDEIQYLSNPSSFMKLIADHHHAIKLIVSGSSSFDMKSKFQDSLVGRTVNFEIFPLSFKEVLLFKDIPLFPDVPLTDIKIESLRNVFQEYALYGGYPKIVLTPELDKKERYLQQIIETYVRKDIRDLAEIRDISKFNKLIEILAAQSGNLVNISELSNTCDLARQTIERYLFILEQTYIIKLVTPFSQNIRTELTKTPKVFLFDTGLMQMLWLKKLQREILGPVFETCIFSELVKLHGVNSISFWRTIDRQEIDFIVRRESGILPIEVKRHFPHTMPGSFTRFWQVSALSTETPVRMISLFGKPSIESSIYPWDLYQKQKHG